MKSPFRSLLLGALSLGLLALTPATALHAQSTKIFVASYGNDANDGSRGSPKRNFQAAHNAVAAGGQIVVLDTAGYGALTISKALTITVPPGVNGFVTVPMNTTSAIRINAGASDDVTLRGLIVEGGVNKDYGVFGSNFGIYATSVRTLTIEDCVIRNFYAGLYFPSSINGGAHCAVRGTTVTNSYYGLDIEAPTAFFVVGLIERCYLHDNTDGLLTGGTGSTFVTLKDSVIASNGTGAVGSVNATISASGCTFHNNGVVSGLANGALFYTFGNNTLFTNGGSSDFNQTVPLK